MPIDFNKIAEIIAEKINNRIEAMSDEELEEWIKRQKEKKAKESETKPEEISTEHQSKSNGS